MAVLFANTFCSFVREFSPPGPREDRCCFPRHSAVSCAVLATETFCSFVRDFSPLGLREGRATDGGSRRRKFVAKYV